ncbi:hypothetical protein BGZ58_008960 [Dissophora ornata]|nr:hypothetical protein BGZ58_008960 [Dissophora ornata]
MGSQNDAESSGVYRKKLGVMEAILTGIVKVEVRLVHKAHGEAGSVDLGKHRLQFEDTAKQVSLFEPRNVFNCDETRKVLPNKNLLFKIASSRKIINDARVSIFLCYNGGSEKRKPFLLCLDVDVEAAFRTDFKGTGYMNMVLFQEWLLELDADMILRIARLFC